MSKILNWFKSLFSKITGLITRPGLEAFIKAHEQEIFDIVKKFFSNLNGAPLNSWRDLVFEEVKAFLAKIKISVPDNWISIAIAFAYEALKAELEKVAGVAERSYKE